jgi:hypothetical protein
LLEDAEIGEAAADLVVFVVPTGVVEITALGMLATWASVVVK